MAASTVSCRREKGDGAGGHDLADNFSFQTEDIDNDLFLGLLDRPGFKGECGDGLQFLGAYIDILGIGWQEPSDEAAEPDDGLEDHNHPADGMGDDRRESEGEAHAQSFGYDFGEDQDCHGEHAGEQYEVFISKKLGRCSTGDCGADGVGDSVQRQNGGNRFIDISTEIQEGSGGCMTRILSISSWLVVTE